MKPLNEPHPRHLNDEADHRRLWRGIINAALVMAVVYAMAVLSYRHMRAADEVVTLIDEATKAMGEK